MNVYGASGTIATETMHDIVAERDRLMTEVARLRDENGTLRLMYDGAYRQYNRLSEALNRIRAYRGTSADFWWVYDIAREALKAEE